MKVVLFCGGMGLRMRGFTQALPKPMVLLGGRPVLWHLMSYYAHYGHKDFILCLGYKGEAIRDFFEDTEEWLALHAAGSPADARAIQREIADWNITFVDTGANANIGDRLQAVRRLVEKEDAFFANYSDGVTTCPVPHLLQQFRRTDAVASMLVCRPSTSFHFVSTCGKGVVTGISELGNTDLWVNAGFFVLRPQIFDFMRPGDELVEAPFARLIEAGKLAAHRYDGFWRCVDTPKDLAAMEALRTEGGGPWEIWRKPGAQSRPKPAIRSAKTTPPALSTEIFHQSPAAHDPA
jgi:glucose-1-phosphate cytidylyltransferase